MSRPFPASKVGSEPIPGYTLRKRLGAGGYGEVWLADAPGGLQKAVKLVYGTVDESHAASELRSLQRIRQVNHPFLLSIERIEIVANQVIIITELAEGSLQDRYSQCRRKGAPGIPRSKLLEMMRDAADALDFLSQKHALQHLDVKPGNLLLIADRIKVADFGLVKDLHDNNQSLVSGLTPVYSAPEIFDGRPDYRSDQYSLAIVYMEMLTGCLPFDGRTTGELARQHINQTPDLEPLPPADRPIIARALSKNPLDRYSSCRLFIEQLLKTRSAVIPAAHAMGKTDVNDGDSEPLVQTEPHSPGAKARPGIFREAISADAIRAEWANPRAYFIGVGGVGGRALNFIREVANQDCDCHYGVNDLGWLAIDTDASDLVGLCNEDTPGSLGCSQTIHLRLYKPNEYRDAPAELFVPLSRRWLYNIPRSLKTEGVRPLAILTLLDHYKQLKQRITSDLKALINAIKKSDEPAEPLRIYVVGSLHGGTGGGLVCEIGRLVRTVMSELSWQGYRLSSLLTAAATTQNQIANLPAAAALATLSELIYLMNPDHETPEIYQLENQAGRRSPRPFDWVSIIDGGLHGNSADLTKATLSLAKAVWIDAQTPVGALLHEERITTVDKPLAWLRSLAAAPVQVSMRISPRNLSRWCCEQTLHHSLRYLLGPKGVATSSTSVFLKDSTGAPTAHGDLPLTEAVCEESTQRLLAELGIATANIDATPEMRSRLALQWSRRLSVQPDVFRLQLAEDIQKWRLAITHLVQMRVYNWKQVEQIQLNVIEGVLNFIDAEANQLHHALSRLGISPAGSRRSLARKAAVYLRGFAEECMQFLANFQREGKTLGGKVLKWCESINAEKALNESTWEVNISSLPPRLRLLACRVNAVLESTVNRLALQAVEASQFALDLPHGGKMPRDVDQVNLRYMLSLSSDLITRISSELGISAEEFNSSEPDDAVSLKKLEKHCPYVTQLGIELNRLIVVPQEQQNFLIKELKNCDLLATTTVVSGTRSLGSYVINDASSIEPARLIASLWRPSPQTLQLAERLRSRSDIDWVPVTSLLESAARNIPEPNSLPAAAPIIPVAPGDNPVGLSGPFENTAKI
jgi:hypothetical protein